jgi:hypothetical protein
MLNGFFN